jgi:hypothetical protein
VRGCNLQDNNKVPKSAKTKTTGRDGKSTDVDLISQEGGPINLVLVNLDQGPVACKLVRFGGGFDSLSVEDESNTTLSRVRPKFGNVTVKIV